MSFSADWCALIFVGGCGGEVAARPGWVTPCSGRRPDTWPDSPGVGGSDVPGITFPVLLPPCDPNNTTPPPKCHLPLLQTHWRLARVYG